MTGFTFMAFFISRLGATPVAGHQIAVNLVVDDVHDAAGARQRDRARWWRSASAPAMRAMRGGSAGTACRSASASRRCVGGAVYLLREPIVGLYTANPVIVAAALPLLAWVALFHIADAAQTIAAFVAARVPHRDRAAGHLRASRSGASASAAATCSPSTSLGIARRLAAGRERLLVEATLGLAVAGVALAAC